MGAKVGNCVESDRKLTERKIKLKARVVADGVESVAHGG